jgi:hypothetical protein
MKRRTLIDLHALAKELKRPVSTLYALSAANDPFHLIPSRVRDAEWFAGLWHRFGRPGLHPHGLHYILVSQPHGSIVVPGTDKPYENTIDCDYLLAAAAKDARYLGLITASDMVDRRNAEAEILHSNGSEPASGGVTAPDCDLDFQLQEPAGLDFPELPRLAIIAPKIPQRYMIEIWIEKSTQGDIINPIAEQYGINVVPGQGQTSETRARELVERALAADKPVRILYVSDLDPAGDNMPVSAARKIEFWIRTKYPDLDVQLRNVALTREQADEWYDEPLPRTPLKHDIGGREHWEQHRGEGGVELDALEALHPGELAGILTEEVQRYYDHGLQERIDETESEVDEQLDQINDEVHAEHEARVGALRDRHEALMAEYRARVAALENQFRERFETLSEDTKACLDTIKDSLDGRFDFDSIDWPEPDEGDEDDDPLFDSVRGYVEQVDRYKRHQGKPIRRKPYKTGTARKPYKTGTTRNRKPGGKRGPYKKRLARRMSEETIKKILGD